MNTCCKLQLLERLSNPHAVAHSCATGDSYCLPLLLGTGRIQGLERGFHPLRRAAQVGGGAEVSGDAGPKAAESTSQLAARAGVLSHIPAPPDRLRKHLRWVVFGHLPPQDCLQPLLAFRAGPGQSQAHCLWRRTLFGQSGLGSR